MGIQTRRPAVLRHASRLRALALWPGLPARSAAPRAERSRAWRALVVVVCLIAGVGFAASARAAHGTNLRAANTGNLPDLVANAEARVRSADAQAARLQQQLNQAEAQAGAQNGTVAAAQRKVGPMLTPAGLSAVQGAGIEVVLDDASDPAADPGVDPNQLVVHQSDLQAVVNALWAGGAQAMSIAGQRVIATSAVRCVGPTLLLNGQVFSPPFRVFAIGPFAAMQDQLNHSPGVKLFRQAAEYYGLGYTVGQTGSVQLPAYSGPVGLSYARPLTR